MAPKTWKNSQFCSFSHVSHIYSCPIYLLASTRPCKSISSRSLWNSNEIASRSTGQTCSFNRYSTEVSGSLQKWNQRHLDSQSGAKISRPLLANQALLNNKERYSFCCLTDCFRCFKIQTELFCIKNLEKERKSDDLGHYSSHTILFLLPVSSYCSILYSF